LAVGTKNNALMLPVSLLIAEFLFFRDLTQKPVKQKATLLVACLLLAVAAAGFYFMDGNRLLVEGYKIRPFSLSQRLLTQPGVVLFHLSQVFYPAPNRFSVVHDVTYSSSLLTPWTTFPSIATILIVIFIAFWCIKKNPILSFAILFFFVNHIIESTFLPLENVFEHRNYLPSLFLFVPIAIGINKTLDYYRIIKKPMFLFLVVSLCAMMVGLGMSSYLRNLDWRSGKTLWMDAMEKAPASARPHFGLAWGYYDATGQHGKAIWHYLRALDLKNEQVTFKANIYRNLAVLSYSAFKDFRKAVEYAENSIEIVPGQHDVNLLLCKALCMLGRYEESLVYLDQWLEKDPTEQEFLYLKGFIALKRLKPEKAIDYFKRCLQISPDRPTYYREIGICLTQMGHHDRGFWFLKRAHMLDPKEAGVLLGLADNRIRAGRLGEAPEYVNRLIVLVGVNNIETALSKASEDPLGLPVFYKEIASLVALSILDYSEKLGETSIRLTQHFSDDR
jgi:Tfp pilus assembly protein PilF